MNKEVIKPIIIPGIKKNYYISNYGRVFNKKTGKFLKGSLDKDGYLRVNLAFDEGNKRSLRVHRLVAIHFIPYRIKGQDDVNHKDGNPLNNNVNNLEWCTKEENNKHAIESGLRWYFRGEQCPQAILTEKQVHIICESLEKGLKYKEICDLLDIEYTESMGKILSNIKRGKAWKHIVSQYNLSKTNMKKVYSDDIIEKICGLIEKGYGNVSIAKEIGYNSKEEKKKLVGIINQIRLRKVHRKISEKYKW